MKTATEDSVEERRQEFREAVARGKRLRRLRKRNYWKNRIKLALRHRLRTFLGL